MPTFIQPAFPTLYQKQSHHEDKPYECKTCEKTFDQNLRMNSTPESSFWWKPLSVRSVGEPLFMSHLLLTITGFTLARNPGNVKNVEKPLIPAQTLDHQRIHKVSLEPIKFTR